MKKQLLFLTILSSLVIVGCGNKDGEKQNSKVAKIKLTEEELKSINNNNNLIAQLLVRKAIEQEMSNVKYTEEQLKRLEEVKKNLEIEFFLESQAIGKVTVQDHEILSIYEENADKLKNEAPEAVLPQIRQAVFQNKLVSEKTNVVNGIINKYKLNDELKKYIPESAEIDASKSVDTKADKTLTPEATKKAAEVKKEVKKTDEKKK